VRSTEAVAREAGNVTQGDEDVLARTEHFAEPRGDSPNHGSSSGYAEGLRGTKAERRTSRRGETRSAMRQALVVGAAVMGATVVAAATFTVLVFGGLFTVSPGVGRGNRPVTLVQQPPATTTLPSLDATDPTRPDDATGAPPLSGTTGTIPPSTNAQTRRPPLPSSNRAALPRTAGDAQVPAQPPSNSSGLQQPFSAPSPPPSDAPAPTPTTAPKGCSRDREEDQPSRCSRG